MVEWELSYLFWVILVVNLITLVAVLSLVVFTIKDKNNQTNKTLISKIETLTAKLMGWT